MTPYLISFCAVAVALLAVEISVGAVIVWQALRSAAPEPPDLSDGCRP